MPALQGEHHPRRKLTAGDVLAIRAAYSPGAITYEALARRYGVTKQAVHQIITRQTWRHVA